MNGAVIASNALARNNIFNISEGQRNPLRVSRLEASHNHYSYGDYGDHSTSGDPLFVDPANGDFHLQAGSPCIDAGTDVSIAEDADGTSMPQGAAPDIGAFEYIGSSAVNAEGDIRLSGFSLSQNYPNPFTPKTTIEYFIPAHDHLGTALEVGAIKHPCRDDAQSAGRRCWHAVINVDNCSIESAVTRSA